MRTNSLACLCAIAGLGLVGCPDPVVTPTDTNLGFADTGARVDARGDGGVVRDTGARDTGAAMNDTGVMTDTGTLTDDAGVDAFVPADDAFGLDAFSAVDAFAGVDAFSAVDAFTSMDAGRDAFVASDAGRDAPIGSDAGRDAFVGSDAFHGDAFLGACAAATHLVINEIDYDQTGADTAEFVEIFNPTAAAIPLAGYSLVAINGSSAPGPEYARVALTGTIAAGGYLLVSASGSSIPGGMFSFSSAIQNGDPDGILLLGPSGIVDTAIYGGMMTTAMLTPGGATPIVESGSIGNDPVIGSLARRPNGCDRDTPAMDWYVTLLATPGAANL